MSNDRALKLIPILAPSSRAVLLALLIGGVSRTYRRISSAKIVDHTGLSRRSVVSALAQLQARGFIGVDAQRGSQTRVAVFVTMAAFCLDDDRSRNDSTNQRLTLEVVQIETSSVRSRNVMQNQRPTSEVVQIAATPRARTRISRASERTFFESSILIDDRSDSRSIDTNPPQQLALVPMRDYEVAVAESKRAAEPKAKTDLDALHDSTWEQFWEKFCWRKVGKTAAAKAFKRRVKTRADVDAFRATTPAWTKVYKAREPQFRPHPATYLNTETWRDAPPPEEMPRREVARDVDVDLSANNGQLAAPEYGFRSRLRSGS